MFSIICCSVHPEAATALERNIAATIGVPFEFIAFDNRELGYGLCKVYNLCAAQAKYDYLCFAHEDICFATQGWGELIARQLSRPDTGVMGFAGSILKLRRLTGWGIDKQDVRQNYSQPDAHGRMKHYYLNPEDTDFSRVISLDGLCLLVRKEVWTACRFDEEVFTGFHLYDLDFTTAVARHWQNYVCNVVEVQHFSVGAFSREWLRFLKIYHDKWRDLLPFFVKKNLSEKAIADYELRGEAAFIKMLFKKHLCSRTEGLRMTVGYIFRHPFSFYSWNLLLKYLKYGLQIMNIR